MADAKRVEGEQQGRVMLYTLSTCGWCRKTKNLLSELGIGYDYIDMDALSSDEKLEVRQTVAKWNPACSFPTMVIDDKECIVGFQEEKIRNAVGK